jgi:hypothetical protein
MKFNNIRELIPRNKSDDSHIVDLMTIKETDVYPILPDLLEWIADVNWPVASAVLKVLARFPNSVIPLIQTALDILAKDDILKYNIIVHLLPLFSIEKQHTLYYDVKRICDNLTDSEKHEAVWEAACDFIEKMEDKCLVEEIQ